MNSIDPISISRCVFDAFFMLHKLPIVCFYHKACSYKFAIFNCIGKIKYICLSEIRYKLRTSTIYLILFIVRKKFCYAGNKANYVVISELKENMERKHWEQVFKNIVKPKKSTEDPNEDYEVFAPYKPSSHISLYVIIDLIYTWLILYF